MALPLASVATALVLLVAMTPPAISQTAHSPNLHELTITQMSRGLEGQEGKPGTAAFQGDLLFAPEAHGAGGIGIFKVLPRAPYLRQISFYDCPGATLHDSVTVWGDYLFQSVNDFYRNTPLSNSRQTLSCNNTNDSINKDGVRIVDISHPRSPHQVGFIQTHCGSLNTTLVPFRGKLYIYDWDANGCESSVSDINPVGTFQLEVYRFNPDHPSTARLVSSPTLTTSGCNLVTVLLRKRLMACTGANTFSIYDIHDPLNPLPIASTTNVETTGLTSAQFTWDGRYIVLADLDGNEDSVTASCSGDQNDHSGVLWIYDVHNINQPLGHFSLPRTGRANTEVTQGGPELECSVWGLTMVPMKAAHRYVVVSGWLSGGVSVVDFSEPGFPKELAYWQPDNTYTPSAYWYNGRIYATDMQKGHGVAVLTVDDLAGRTRDFKRRLNAATQMP